MRPWRTQVRSSAARTLGPPRREEAIALTREAQDLAEAKAFWSLFKQARELLAELGVSD